jgi:hypothetical protein
MSTAGGGGDGSIGDVFVLVYVAQGQQRVCNCNKKGEGYVAVASGWEICWRMEGKGRSSNVVCNCNKKGEG